MRIHFIAIGGSIMHNLALELHYLGHEVSGSDDIIYDPAKSKLAEEGILPAEFGWFHEKISQDIDLIILGMHAKKDNAELLKSQELGLKIQSFPEFLGEHSKEKITVAVCGSHGKTTTTSLIMHILRENNIKFDYAVGAQLEGFDRMVGLSDAPIMVIEGDEYLSSAIDRRSKFLHYHPDIATITGVEWDHVNVFPSLDEYLKSFKDLIASMTEDSVLVFNGKDEAVVELVNSTPSKGNKESYTEIDHVVSNGVFALTYGDDSIPIQVIGRHNMENIGAAFAVCKHLGLSRDQIINGVKSFSPPAIRMNKISESKDKLVLRDYAHSPSKVGATVSAMSEMYPSRKLVVVLELHTYSSLNRDFIPFYKGTLDKADAVCIYYNPRNLVIKRLPEIDSSFIKEAFGLKEAKVVSDPLDIEDFLLEHDGIVGTFLLMSSSNFGGLDVELLFAPSENNK